MNNTTLALGFITALLFAGFAFGNIANSTPTGSAVQSIDGPLVRNSEEHKEALYWPTSILTIAASTIIIALAISKRGRIRW